MADWSRLPSDLVRAIANQLGEAEDFAAFLMVCSSWRSAVPKQEWNPRVPQLPWLILAESSGSESATTTRARGFYNIGRNKRYDLNVPETYGRRCWGSEIGWMFTVGMDLQTHLFNPLSHVQISLPPLTTFEIQQPYGFDFEEEKPPYPDWIRTRFVRRACVINGNNRSAPFVTPNNIVVMAIYHPMRSYLALARPGYESWVSLQGDGWNSNFHDVVYFKDQIFAVRLDGTLVLCEIEGPDPPKATDFASPPEDVECWECIYLVESAGELLMVLRLNQKVEDYEHYYKTESFEVYKFDFSARKWTELLDLGDQTLFLGANCSMSVRAVDLNCKANSIYFADDSWFFWHKCEGGGGHDMGIFNMEGMTFEPLYLGDDSRSHFSPPTWVMPRLA